MLALPRADHRRDPRHAAALERVHHPVDARLVVERVLLLVEGAELRDVGAGGERLVAGAGDQDRLHRAVAVGVAADLGQALVHGEGEGVPRLRPVEGDVRDAVAHFVQEFVHALDDTWE